MSILSPFHSTDSRSTMVKNHNENIIKAYMLYRYPMIKSSNTNNCKTRM